MEQNPWLRFAALLWRFLFWYCALVGAIGMLVAMGLVITGRL